MSQTITKHVKIKYTPRWYQKEMEKAHARGIKRLVLCWARRHGKDYACWHLLLLQALKVKGTYFYVFPEYAQGKRIIWDGITESGVKYIDLLPQPTVVSKNSTEMKLHLFNGSIIQVVGSENYDALRGTNPVGVVLSEWAYQTPHVWDLVLEPVLLKNGGWAIFNSTPNGRNHFYELCNYAATNPDWFYSCITNKETNYIGQEEFSQMKARGLSEDIIQQEYYCSFEIGVQGSYYGKSLARAHEEGRVGVVALDPNFLVYTAWDIGISDAMSIIFFQRRGNEILVIDHYENRGYALNHYITELKAKGYCYGAHFVPHDAKLRSAGRGETFIEVGRQLGVELIPIPNQLSILEGIEKVRGLFPRMLFDAKKCDYLIKCLGQYHAEYDDRARVFRSTPKHDWSSHAADALRILALSESHHALSTSSLSAASIQEMRAKAGWQPTSGR